jgi:hypothetical protein
MQKSIGVADKSKGINYHHGDGYLIASAMDSDWITYAIVSPNGDVTSGKWQGEVAKKIILKLEQLGPDSIIRTIEAILS